MYMKIKYSLSTLVLLAITACAPTVKVEAPEKPIVINMNINISHEIKVKVDKELENSFNTKQGIF